MRQIIKPTILFACIYALLFASVAQAKDDALARKLINSQGCKACHALDGDGSTLFISFAAMREKLSRAEIRAKLVNPVHRHGDDKIRDFSHLSHEEIQALVEFIQPNP